MNPGTISEQQPGFMRRESATGVTFDSVDEKIQRRSERAVDLENTQERKCMTTGSWWG